MKFIPRACRMALALTTALSFAPAAHAGTDRWTPYGPGDGPLQSLVASTRGELFVTTSFSTGEIWQRPGVGTAWRWRGEGLGQPGLPGVTALAVHPKNPNALWAVASASDGTLFQSVFRSMDAGATWRKLFTGDIDFQIVRLSIAPTARSVVLLAETGSRTTKRLLRRT